MIKIKRALISVSDKKGIIDFAKILIKYNVEILSTGGTAKLFAENNIPVIEVSDYTGFPEMLDGRVKTLHPKIHGGILGKRDDEKHLQTMIKSNIPLIDLVVVNLYPFEATISKENCPLSEAIENIDIGGPAMIRSSAKNYNGVAVVTDSSDYKMIEDSFKNRIGSRLIYGGIISLFPLIITQTHIRSTDPYQILSNVEGVLKQTHREDAIYLQELENYAYSFGFNHKQHMFDVKDEYENIWDYLEKDLVSIGELTNSQWEDRAKTGSSNKEILNGYPIVKGMLDLYYDTIKNKPWRGISQTTEEIDFLIIN